MRTLFRIVLFLLFLVQHTSSDCMPTEGMRENASLLFASSSFAVFDQQNAPEQEAELLPYVWVQHYARISFNTLQTDLVAGSFQKITVSTESRIGHSRLIFPPWLKYQSYILFPFHEFN